MTELFIGSRNVVLNGKTNARFYFVAAAEGCDRALYLSNRGAWFYDCCAAGRGLARLVNDYKDLRRPWFGRNQTSTRAAALIRMGISQAGCCWKS